MTPALFKCEYVCPVSSVEVRQKEPFMGRVKVIVQVHVVVSLVIPVWGQPSLFGYCVNE